MLDNASAQVIEVMLPNKTYIDGIMFPHRLLKYLYPSKHIMMG